MWDVHQLLDTPKWKGIAHLGIGSSGSVQLVENKLADAASRKAGTHVCAAKVLNAEAEVSAAALVKHSELVHSNVLRFVEAFPLSTPTCTTLCVVTELAAGGNLWTLMECCPLSTSEIQVARKSTWNVFPLTEPTARCVIQQCLLALQYLHAQGNYGCSLTPQSVLMSQWWMQRDALPGEQRSDFAPVVVLGGFNYVTNELLPRGSASSQVAVPSFLPPERQDVPAGNPPLPPLVAARADTWSLGVLLFFALSGEFPFTLCTELKNKHLRRIRARISSAAFVEPAIKALERMPAGAKDLLQNLLVVDVHRRFDTWQVLQHPWIQEQMPASFLSWHATHLQGAQRSTATSNTAHHAPISGPVPPPMPRPPAAPPPPALPLRPLAPAVNTSSVRSGVHKGPRSQTAPAGHARSTKPDPVGSCAWGGWPDADNIWAPTPSVDAAGLLTSSFATSQGSMDAGALCSAVPAAQLGPGATQRTNTDHGVRSQFPPSPELVQALRRQLSPMSASTSGHSGQDRQQWSHVPPHATAPGSSTADSQHGSSCAAGHGPALHTFNAGTML